jgi:hypothetical protein
MAGEDRLTLLMNQFQPQGPPPEVTGIDFIQVVDPSVQTRLRIVFLIDPAILADPIVNAADLPIEVPPAAVEIISVSGGERLARVPVVRAIYRQVNGGWPGADPRTILEIQTAEPGDFSIYRLTLKAVEYVFSELRLVEPEQLETRIDRFFNGVEFSFKQGCPSVLDCRPPEPECPPEDWVDFPVDYLARDFVSLRNALLDFAAQRYPQWGEKIEADAGVMLAEVMAALGDELAYIQDRYAREAYLETATQRRSLRHHARLVDYAIDEGLSASTWLDLTVANDPKLPPGVWVQAGSLVWAPSQGEASIPFELGLGLWAQAEARRPANDATVAIPQEFWVHADWNAMPVHVPDEGQPCLPVDSTELFLQGTFPIAFDPRAPEEAQLPEGASSQEFWLGRWMVLQTRPEDPSVPIRRHLIRIAAVEQFVDQLCLDENDNPLSITRIQWEAEQATPFEMCLNDMTVHGNLVIATAGETITEYFSIEQNQDIPANLTDSISQAIARQGPLNDIECQRSVAYRYSLRETEARGLGWLTQENTRHPEIDLQEVDAVTLTPLSNDNEWQWQADLLGSTSLQDHYTLEEGTWRRVIGFRRMGETIVHEDYASGDGFTIRFGDGEFASVPAAEKVFQVRYRTGPGTRANLPADTITILANPVDGTVSFNLVEINPADPEDKTVTPLAGEIVAVTNPFPITDGRDPEPAEVIKQLAPEAFRAVTYRAVRTEDYAEIAERLPWVQQAGAQFRWTGSWLSTFVTADPVGAFELSDDRRTELASLMDCVRQVGREVFVRDPQYLNLDLQIRLCIQPFAYPGQVKARVLEALMGKTGLPPTPGFFHPDNFTFGTPLERSQLEATIQAVPGVLSVEQMRLRVRGLIPWQIFDGLTFPVGQNQIIRLQNDPRFPERGSLQIYVRHEQQEPTGEDRS